MPATRVDPVEELEDLSARSTEQLELAMERWVRAYVEGRDTAPAFDALWRLLGQVLILSHILGRRRVALLTDAAEPGADLAERMLVLGAREWLRGLFMPAVKFAEAIRDMLKRTPRVAVGYEAVQRVYATEYAFAIAKSTERHLTAHVQKTVARMMSEGAPVAKAEKVIAEMGAWTKAYGENVYRTNLATAYSSGLDAQVRDDPDADVLFPAYEFNAVRDAATRPNHGAAHGLLASRRDPVWDRFTPPLGYQCILPGERVSGLVEAAVRSTYRGPAVELETWNGARLRVTANHPVLSGRGWVPAGALREGDEVLRYRGDVERRFRGDLPTPTLPPESVRAKDDDEMPARVEDVFESLAAHGAGSVAARSLPLDFHGDALFAEREVHVVRADRRLPGSPSAVTVHRVEDLLLVAAEAPAAALHREGALAPLRHAPYSSARRRPRGAYLALDDLPVVGELLSESPLEPLRVGAATGPDPLFQQHPADDRSADGEALRGSLLALPGSVARDEIRSVRHFDWSGHVYDLQTETGWIVASGIVISNCRCSIRLVQRAELRQRGLLKDNRVVTVHPPRWAYASPDPGFGHRKGAPIL